MHYSWVELHGALTHFPIALLLMAFVFEIGASVLRKPEWKTVSFWLLAVAVLAAIPTLFSGWMASRDLFPGGHAPPQYPLHWKFAWVSTVLAAVWLGLRIVRRDKLTGAVYQLSIVLALAAAAAVSYTGFLGGSMVFGGGGGGSDSASPASNASAAPAALPKVDPKLVVAGRLSYNDLRCYGCHRINGQGATSGPDLTHEAQRHSDMAWQVAHLKDPQKMKPNSAMPAFGDQSDESLKALAAYLVTRQ